MQCDWNRITSSAYLSLLELNLNSFPINPKKFKFKGVRIASFQKYSEITGLTVEEITCNRELDDAFVLKGLREGVTLILYNKNKYGSRVKHSLLHEVGHIKLNHKKHGAQEEIEAHFFASQMNAPNVLLREISRRGHRVDALALKQHFELSDESAVKKQDYLKRHSFEHSNDFDDVILSQFSMWLNQKFPLKAKHVDDDYFYEMEREREGW